MANNLKIYVGEIGSAYTEKVEAYAYYLAALQNVEDAITLSGLSDEAYEDAEAALTRAQAALADVKTTKSAALTAYTNAQQNYDTALDAYNVLAAAYNINENPTAEDAAELANAKAVLDDAADELHQVWNVLVETDADLWDDNRHDGYEDLMTANVANIEALIDDAKSNAAFALAHISKAKGDAEAAYQDFLEKKGKFEALLPEDFDVLPTNEENDEIEKQIAAAIKRINEGIAACNAITASIVESTNKINKAIITISIEDDKYNITLGVGETEEVTASVNAGNVVWASSNKSIARVTYDNTNATITAVAPGIAKVVAMSTEDDNETVIIVVTVTDDSDDGSN